MRTVDGAGPVPARIMIVGDFPGAEDTIRGLPFQGSAGAELRRMLADAGIPIEECYMTNLFNFRPASGSGEEYFDFKKKKPIGGICDAQKARLLVELDMVQPNIIICLGGLALWSFIGDSAISTWRGSMLTFQNRKLIPTYHPSQIMRMWEWRAFAIRDLTRAAGEYKTKEYELRKYSFIVRPEYDAVMEQLWHLTARADSGELKLSVDLETRLGFMACIGIAWSQTSAMCIPLMCVESLEGYWTAERELAITLAVRDLLTHPNVRVVGQNFLYDAQYFAKEHGYVPNLTDDTMFMQHTLFPGLPKGLDFLASMYCKDYTYWKAEGKTWDASMPEEQLWEYNCKDACFTYEISDVLPQVLINSNLTSQYTFLMNMWQRALTIMLRGVRIDRQYRQDLIVTLMEEIAEREVRLAKMVGHPLNPKSPLQMRKFFYDDCKLPVQYSRKGTRGVTCDDEALQRLSRREPLIAPVCKTIAELRSLGVFLSTFVLAKLSEDGRMRSSFNPAGTETFRFSSSKDAFDSGANLQNIPKGNEDEDPEAQKLELPNIRKLYIPDPGHIIFDVDLAGADAQVVAWEAEDDILKEIFRSGQKLHAINAKDLFGGDAGPDGKKEPYYTRTKMGCHLSNYGGTPRTMSSALAITMHEAERFQKRWFEIHPGIKHWHQRVEAQLQTTRQVSNKFGFRRFYFDRVEGLLPEALAWIPQSTVAIVTNKQWTRLNAEIPEIQILLQVHDSLVGQCKISLWPSVKARLRESLKIIVPYDDPLIISSGLKTSTRSWGHGEDEKWD